MRILFIYLFISLSFSQEDIEKMIDQVLNGSIDKAMVYLPEISQNYPNNPSVMFLQGLLESDGEQAKIIFSKLYKSHPTSKYGDDAVMKVAEYFYSEGLYVQAAEWLKKMPIYYSRSEHIERAVKLFLNSLIVSGHKDTAIFYSRVFTKQFPSLNVDDKIAILLDEFEASDKIKSEIINELNMKSNYTNVNDSEEKAYNKISEIKYGSFYSLQSGAFSHKDNANLQKLKLSKAGFDSRIMKLYKNSTPLYAVRIGYYNNRSDANLIAKKIKHELDLDTIVIKNK